MRTLNAILVFLLMTVPAYAGNESATSRLNADLVPIYESLTAPGPSTSLVGRRLELTLKLRHASDRYLLFTDTQVVVDKETRYYLIKWKFKPDDVKALLGKSNVTCKVMGTIVEVVKGATSPRMPYVMVELVSAEVQ